MNIPLVQGVFGIRSDSVCTIGRAYGQSQGSMQQSFVSLLSICQQFFSEITQPSTLQYPPKKVTVFDIFLRNIENPKFKSIQTTYTVAENQIIKKSFIINDVLVIFCKNKDSKSYSFLLKDLLGNMKCVELNAAKMIQFKRQDNQLFMLTNRAVLLLDFGREVQDIYPEHLWEIDSPVCAFDIRENTLAILCESKIEVVDLPSMEVLSIPNTQSTLDKHKISLSNRLVVVSSLFDTKVFDRFSGDLLKHIPCCFQSAIDVNDNFYYYPGGEDTYVFNYEEKNSKPFFTSPFVKGVFAFNNNIVISHDQHLVKKNLKKDNKVLNLTFAPTQMKQSGRLLACYNQFTKRIAIVDLKKFKVLRKPRVKNCHGSCSLQETQLMLRGWSSVTVQEFYPIYKGKIAVSLPD